MRQREVLKFLLDLDHDVTWTEVLVHYGLHRAKEVGRTLQRMKESGKIIIDSEGEIVITAITNAKLQRLVDEAVRIS